MRFQDFDVLLFPHGSHVPIREFRTACFAQQESQTLTTTPLLTCFVPSIAAGSAFQISVHSWTKPTSILGANQAGYAVGINYQWRIKVTIDGRTASVETYGEDTTWPKQLDKSSNVDADGKHLLLGFPKFHKQIMAQSHWNACDDLGRIKVYLSAGYMVQMDGKPQFVKLVDHVIFAFQPAPLNVLERSGIAWPNPNLPIVNNPLQPPEARKTSLGGLPSLDDGSSRSTSAYSMLSPAAYLPLEINMTGAFPVVDSGHRGMHVRLPSDQVQRIIDALGPNKNAAAAAAMPPPPVPQRSMVTPANNMIDRRGDSRYSDISMHAGCTSYPLCITEDADGHVIHEGPSEAVRGRKEGSSPSKPRDFLSTVLDTPVPAPAAAPSNVPDVSSPPTTNSSAKKRTRSALRSLTLNDGGSPEKKDKARKVTRLSSGSDKENDMVE